MTLILTYLSEASIVQVSDRRLTSAQADPHEENKVVVLDGRILFSYTGIADLDRKHMYVWLANWLAANAKADLGMMFDHMLTDLRASLARLSIETRHKKLGIAACSWITDQKTGIVRPAVVEIANFHGDTMKLWSPDALTFKRSLNAVAPERMFALHWIGQQIPKDLISPLIRSIGRSLRRRTSLGPPIKLMIDCVRMTSKRFRSVGKDLMVVHLPRSAFESGRMGLGVGLGPELSSDDLSCVYMKDGSDGSLQLAPAYVTSRLSGYGSLVMYASAVSGKQAPPSGVLDRRKEET